MSRRKGRYERRKTRREENRLRRAATVGGLHDVFGYDDMYKAGKKCCNGVRWKNSTQRFEMHLYMDDYYVIVPPDRDAKEIMALIVAKAESLKLTVSKSKSRIVPLTKPFRYCKAKFILTETGRVVMNGNRDGVKRARRKIKAFRTKIQNGEMSYDDLWTSVNGMLAYFESYDDHNRVLRLRRLFYSVFGFSPERIENFRERGKKDEICCA